MSHLVPVLRPDKNGKMVTRHVSASQPPSASSLATIPPMGQRGVIAASGRSMEAARGRRWLLTAVTKSIPHDEVPYMRHSRDELAKKVKLLPDSVAEAFSNTGQEIDDDRDKKMFSRMMVKCLDSEATPLDIENAIHYFATSDGSVRSNIDEYFEFGAKTIADYPMGNLISAVRSYDLEGFNFDPEAPISKQDDRTLEQCAALKALHYAADGVEQWEPDRVRAFAEDGTLLEVGLAQLAVDRPEIVEDIISVIEERHTLDAELITSIFDSAASAMREGTL